MKPKDIHHERNHKRRAGPMQDRRVRRIRECQYHAEEIDRFGVCPECEREIDKLLSGLDIEPED
jgi:hypothetical protein